MPLTNSPHPDAMPLDSLPATAAQIARLKCYGRDCYAPINFDQIAPDRLQVLLARFVDCSESGKRWSGRIKATIAVDGKVVESQVYPAELVKLAHADEPPKRSRRGKTKPKPEQAQTDVPKFWVGQLVKIPAGNRAWVDALLDDDQVAVEVEFLGKDTYPAHLLTPVETEPPAPELPTEPTYKPGQRVRFLPREHDELAGTLGTVEQVGGARLLVRSDEAGLVTVGADEVELVEEQPHVKRCRSRKKAS